MKSVIIIAIAFVLLIPVSVFAELAPFVDPNLDPQYYVDRYNNEITYKDWFDKTYPEYVSIYEAVGILDNQKLGNTFGMSDVEIQAKEEIENPCSKIPDQKRNCRN